MTEPDPFVLFLETIAIAARPRRLGEFDAADLVDAGALRHAPPIRH